MVKEFWTVPYITELQKTKACNTHHPKDSDQHNKNKDTISNYQYNIKV